ncbi:MAG TPA: bifunctional diguanylate cyclase/phosphodiesterase [Streptosporangiaceae bacterium]|nr:bifunctional diguanylate cyclase/phosphodiesterase [Streptosporangiaceae bacterium]
MTSVALGWSAAWILVAAAAGTRLWYASTGRELFVKNGYRWLAAAAVCLGVGGAVQQTFGGLLGGASPLRVADLISLGALLAIVIGLATVTADRCDRDHGHGEPSRWRLYPAGADEGGQVGPGNGAVLDSALLVVSLFAIALVTMFGADYIKAGAGPGAFALDLLRPVADLAALGLALVVLPRNPRLAVSGVFALVAIAIADSLAVAARSAGSNAGVGAHLALVAGIALLAATPTVESAGGRLAKAGPWARGLAGMWSAESRVAAPAATVAAALVIAGAAVLGHPVAISAVAVTAAIGVILLVIRLGWFARRAGAVTASAQAFDGVFRALADSTSDAVLICDRTGIIEYVSHGSGEFGYGQDGQTGDGLIGTALADIVHPEDRGAGVRAAMIALRSAAGTATFTGRARSADGSWRQVKAMLSRYDQPGEPARLLITCHDDSEVVALRRQLAQLTFHDGLTGLPNRAYLEDRVKDLRQGASERTTVAAIMVGLDGLDGHAAMADLDGQHGENLVLAQAGRRLRAAAPPEAMVARWGSEQFAVLIGDIGSAGQQAAELAERLADAISAVPFAIDTKEVWITASVGVATSPATSAYQVLGNSHVAMTKAAAAGGGRVKVFGTAMAAMARRRVELAAALGEAVVDHQVQVEYQPVVELATSLVTSVEAVFSWRPAGERIHAEELLAVAEESGQIVEMGDWLLREAIRQVARWRASGPAIGLVVHVSARQLSAPGFAASVLSALDAAGLPTQVLTLAVDERVLIDAGAMLKSELAGLRGTGVRIAIDDFGTGHASLSYLRQLSVDVIKIGSSLTAGLGTDPTLTLLTSAISGLSRDLGIETIATGVDRPEQVELLKAMGCGLGQGGWLAGQLPASAVDPMAAGLAAGWAECRGGPAADVADGRSQDQAGDPACSPAGG